MIWVSRILRQGKVVGLGFVASRSGRSELVDGYWLLGELADAETSPGGLGGKGGRRTRQVAGRVDGKWCDSAPNLQLHFLKPS